MTRFPQIGLADICEINPRLPQSHNLPDTATVSFVPMAAVDEIFGEISVRLTRPYSEVRRGYTSFLDHDVLFAKITPCMQNGKAAIARQLFSGVGFGSTEFHVLRPKNAVLPEWIFYFVRQPSFREEAKRNFAGTAGHQRVPNAFLQGIQIPLPPLGEQHRLVDLLSRAEGIVRLRREAQRKAAELIPALFLDMFGDPASNPKGWPTASIGDLVERFEGGKNVQAGDAESAEYRILKISAVTSGRYIESEAKPAPPGLAPPAAHFVRAGDLLFSRANTEALVGAVALVEETDGTTLLPDKLWRFVWRNETTVHQTFALHLFQQASTRAMLSSIASGTGGSMKNISQAKLKRLRLPVPPVQLQQQFVGKADAVHSIVAQQTNALATAQSTFDALLSRSFQR